MSQAHVETEFFIPRRMEELEAVDNRVPGQYYVDAVMDVKDLSPTEQLSTLQAVIHELSKKEHIMTIHQSNKFDAVYSYVRHIDDVSRDCKLLLSEQLPGLLKKLCKMVAPVLAKDTSAIDPTFFVYARSTLKMYTFLIAQLMLTIEVDVAPTLSQRSGRKPGGKAHRPVVAAVDLSVKETALRALLDVLSPELDKVWGAGGRIEETLLNCVLRSAVALMGTKANVFETNGETTAVGEGIQLLLAALAHRYITSREKSAASVDVREIMVGPLVEALMKHDFVARFVPRLFHVIDGGETNWEWPKVFIRGVIEVVCANSVNSVDSASAKNIALFIDQVAESHIGGILDNMDILGPQINNECFEVRKTIMTATAELIVKRYANPRTPEEVLRRDALLEDLMSRFMDLNPFARMHCVKLWTYMWDGKAIPRLLQYRVLENAVRRLEDRNNHVRKAAFNLIQMAIKKNTLGSTCLSLHKNKQKHDELLAELKGLVPEPEIFQQSLEESQTGRLSVPAPGPYADKWAKLAFYDNAIHFITQVQAAVEVAFTSLNSKVAADVLEAIDFIATCNEFRVDSAVDGVQRLFPLVYVTEPVIQEAVRVAFCQIMFSKQTASPLMARNIACTKKLLAMVMRSDEGTIAALETICQQLPLSTSTSGIVTDDIMGTVWGVATGINHTDFTPIEARHAMRLFAVLAFANPKAMRDRVIDVLQVIFPTKSGDNMLCSYVCHALERLTLLKNFKPLPRTDPLVLGLQSLVTKRTSQLELWLMLAESAMGTIGTLCEAPRDVFSVVVRDLSARAQKDAAQYEAASTPEHKSRVVTSLTQFCFVIGHAAMKELVFIDILERQQLSRAEDKANEPAVAGGDQMLKELGLDSREYRREEIREQCEIAKAAILSPDGVYAKHVANIVTWSSSPGHELFGDTTLRSAAVLSLCKFMIISEEVCRERIQLLFTILKKTREWWVRTNILVALGDLLCTHPNVVQPYMHPSEGHLFDLLHDADHRVRSTTVMVCTHLALNDMLRVAEMVPLLIVLVADDDATISNMGKVFLQELHNKNKAMVYNLFPTIMMHLSSEFGEGEKFNVVMRLVIEKLEKDKQTESTVEKVCAKFPMIGSVGMSDADIAVARNIAFCLSEFNYSADKTVAKVISEQCFGHYKKWLRDETVKKFITSIAAKAKRSVPGVAGGESRRDKASVEDWEKRLQGEAVDEAERNSGVVPGRNSGGAKPAGKAGKRAKKSNTDDDEESSSSNSDSSEDCHPSAQNQTRAALEKRDSNASQGSSHGKGSQGKGRAPVPPPKAAAKKKTKR